MLNIAQSKMPNVHLYKGDFTLGLVEKLQNHRYDFIIATYSLHHLTDYKKVSLLNDLYGLLKDGGKILFGDVAFHTKEELKNVKTNAKMIGMMKSIILFMRKLVSCYHLNHYLKKFLVVQG